MFLLQQGVTSQEQGQNKPLTDSGVWDSLLPTSRLGYEFDIEKKKKSHVHVQGGNYIKWGGDVMS